MTPLEFLLKLKKLPPDTQLAIAHLGATFEMLSSVLVKNSSSIATVKLTTRLTSESGLADWLGEPLSTIEKWRINGSSASPRKYHLGSVYEWIITHIVPMFSTQIRADENSDIQFSEIAEVWKMRIPVMIVNDKLVGFFRSIADEATPSDYKFVGVPDFSFLANNRTNQSDEKLNNSLIALSKFQVAIIDSKAKAREIYNQWNDQEFPEISLSFFKSSLIHDVEFANEIVENADDKIHLKEFNVTFWLWQILIENDFCSLNEYALIDTLELFHDYGVDLNSPSFIQDDHGHEIFNGNISHLLADTTGDFFKFQPIENCTASYEKILNSTLNLGLDLDSKNSHHLTARQIANLIDEIHGSGYSLLKNFIWKYELQKKLNLNLNPRKIKGSTNSI